MIVEGAPHFLWIKHDDYHAKYVGSTADNRQFFITTPFVPASKSNSGCEFIALYLFHANGNLLEAKIDNLGARQQVDTTAAKNLIQTRLDELSAFNFGNIKVAPFTVEQFGIEFGLIPREPEEDGDNWTVELQPGNYMAFYPPWDGDYDT